MAVLGIQLVVSMIAASLLSKFSSHFSFGRWILTNGWLLRYQMPTEDDIRKFSGIDNGKNRGPRKNIESSRRSKDQPEPPLNIPRSTFIQLKHVHIKSLDLLQLKFYLEYQWLMDVALCGLCVYTFTEIYNYFVLSAQEMNLSTLWCIMIIGFGFRTLLQITSIYFKTEEGGEKVLCVLFAFFFLILAMAILIVDENTIEFEFDTAYKNFTTSANQFLNKQHGTSSEGLISLVTIKIFLAFFASVSGALLTFPGLRLARMTLDTIHRTPGQQFLHLFLYANILAPLFIVLMWVRPLCRTPLTSIRIFQGSAYPALMTEHTFDIMRLSIILIFCILRVSLAWPLLQSHLEMAQNNLNELRKEAGRITVPELQRIVINVYAYLCVVALQYLGPLILLLFFTLLLKSLGGYNILVNSFVNEEVDQTRITEVKDEESVLESAARWTATLSQLKHIFTAICFRALLSFNVCWICMSLFVTTAFGLLYYLNFSF